MNKLRIIFISIVVAVFSTFNGCKTATTRVIDGMYWHKDHLFPMFGRPADVLDDINENLLTNAEAVVFSTLQGLVNMVQPRIIITKTPEPDFDPINSTVQESLDPWLETLGITDEKRNRIPYDEIYTLVAKYRKHVKGLVVYNCPSPDVFDAMSFHYSNLASSVANIYGYLPVTEEIRKNIEDAGVTFGDNKVIDLTHLAFDSGLDVYQYLYDNYWKNNSKRLIVCLHPSQTRNSPYRLTATRDIAAATGAAFVALHISSDKENAGKLYDQFLKDMADSRSVTGETASVLGWFETEPSGIQASTKFGVGAVPSQFFSSGTFFGGMDHTIRIPVVPKREQLNNQIYIALYMSDGDNLHFVQNTMRLRWETARQAGALGEIPVTWTIGPALADIAPAIMNYFYDNAGPNNCFAVGPSGAQYITPYSQPGSREGTGNYLEDEEYTEYFTKLTEKYLLRTGLRTITLWHNATDMVRESFEKNCRYLYGLTLQDRGPFPSATVNNRLRFEKFSNDYCNDIKLLESTLKAHIDEWDGNSPLFLSAQIDSWNRKVDGNVAIADLLKFSEELKADYPDYKIDFIRGDHWFSLYNEANGLPFDLCMNATTMLTSSIENSQSSIENQNSKIENCFDGSLSTYWDIPSEKDIYLEFDFGAAHKLERYVIRFADAASAAKAWTVEVSVDKTTWATIDVKTKNRTVHVDVDFAPIEAKYLRISFVKAKGRIAEIEVFSR